MFYFYAYKEKKQLNQKTETYLSILSHHIGPQLILHNYNGQTAIKYMSKSQENRCYVRDIVCRLTNSSPLRVANRTLRKLWPISSGR